MNQARQVKTTLKGARLSEFDALREHLGLNPSGVLKLAVRKLALLELQNQAASSGFNPKEAA